MSAFATSRPLKQDAMKMTGLSKFPCHAAGTSNVNIVNKGAVIASDFPLTACILLSCVQLSRVSA
jgi:hypothetical protein